MGNIILGAVTPTISAEKWDGTGLYYLVIGGGGAGGAYNGGGGGAGGYRTNWAGSSGTEKTGGNSTINETSAPSLTFDRGVGYTIQVGRGGVAASGNQSGGISNPGSGENSQLGSLIAIGGGRGGEDTAGYPNRNFQDAATGGSGGGAPRDGRAGGTPYSDGANGTAYQGFGGGNSNATGGWSGGGGGGGAGQAGGNGLGGTRATERGGDGGDGLQSTITGTATYRAGGGGGGLDNNDDIALAGDGGLGGGSGGQIDGGTIANPTVHTGSASGGAHKSVTQAPGASGIVILRFPASAGYSKALFESELSTTSGLTVTETIDSGTGDCILELKISTATSSSPRGTSSFSATWTRS